MLIDTRPATVDLKVYGGDTLTFRVNVTGADYSLADWSGQVRLDHDSAKDADFVIAPDATGATVTLPEAAATALLELGTSETPAYGAAKTSLVRKYYGVWDVQVDDGTAVKTLVQGLIEVYADVTKVI